MPHLSLSLLGSFQAALDGLPVTGFKSNKERALLAYLAVEADRPHRREMLAGLAALVASLYLYINSYLSMNSVEPLIWMCCAWVLIRRIK